VSEQRPTPSSEQFARGVRETNNRDLDRGDHHPTAGYTPRGFRHYIRRVALLAALETHEFSTALDVGCSEGFLTNSVAEHFGVDAWGVDLSTTAVAKGHDRYKLPLAAAEATRLPFADGTFDLVFSTEVIEHVLDPALMIAEMRRVARKTVVVTTPISQSPDEHEPDFDLQDVGHINNFDRATVKQLFGPDAQLASFRCNATLALIVAVGRYMPSPINDGFYAFDHRVSQRWGSPERGLRPLRNRDWLITVPGTASGSGSGSEFPRWVCPTCRTDLTAEADGGVLRCATCDSRYAVHAGVPDFFEPTLSG
jgi:hypothetical protein